MPLFQKLPYKPCDSLVYSFFPLHEKQPVKCSEWLFYSYAAVASVTACFVFSICGLRLTRRRVFVTVEQMIRVQLHHCPLILRGRKWQKKLLEITRSWVWIQLISSLIDVPFQNLSALVWLADTAPQDFHSNISHGE